MNWAVWGSLFLAALAGTTLAISFYWHWAHRYTKKWLGVTAEVALGVFLLAMGSAAITFLLTHMPHRT